MKKTKFLANCVALVLGFTVSLHAANLNWRPLYSPGNGGHITSLSICPNNTDLVLAGGDMLGISYSTNGGLTWQDPSEPSGCYQIEDFTWDPNSATNQTVWVGTMAGPWKSTDNGKTWVAKRGGMPGFISGDYVTGVQKVLYDPANSSRLLALMGTHRFMNHLTYPQQGQVWQSLDGGETWALYSSSMNGKRITSASYKLTGTDGQTRVFAATASGFFVSTDSGLTWTEKATGLPAAGKSILSLAVNALDGSVLWITVSGGGVYQSVDSGETWTAKNTGIAYATTTANLDTIASAPSSPNLLQTSDSSTAYHINYRSTDGGATWTSSGMTFGQSPYPVYRDFHCIEVIRKVDLVRKRADVVG